MVENSFVDVAVIENTLTSKKLIIEPHVQMPWRFVVAPTHPLARASNITAEMMAQQTWIMGHVESDAREIVVQYLQDIGLDAARLRVAMELGSMTMIKQAVEAQQGVALLPQVALTKELKLGTLASPPLEQVLNKPLSFIYKQQKFPLKVVDELLNLSRKAPGVKKAVPAHVEAAL